MPSRRRLARVVAMQAVFEMEMRETDPERSLEQNIAEFGGKQAVDVDFARSLLAGVCKESEKISAAVQQNAPQWPLERMDTITRSILLIGAFELLCGKDAPPAVVMNEAIEVAKEYGTEESAKFVNGVLNALANPSGSPKVV